MTFEQERSVRVVREGPVATIELLPFTEAFALQPPADVHWDLQVVLNKLRDDDSIRVVVITGRYEGEFLVTPETETYRGPGALARLVDPPSAQKMMLGIKQLHMTMAEMDKPIVAKVNGDAIGFGQSIVFSSDLIYARDDARFNDVHLGQGDVIGGIGNRLLGPPFGTVPGDGAGVTVPLFMSPVKAKEYLMLARTLTAAELANMHCINSAVPAEELDGLVAEVVDRLLSRSQPALGWTKRVVNRGVIDHLRQGLDQAVAFEMLNFLHQGAGGSDVPRPPAES